MDTQVRELHQTGIRERLLAGQPLAERRLELAGVETAVLEAGDGPPLVLLHGPGEFGLTWLRVVPDLAETHRVVVPDLPGHGASSLPDGPLDDAQVLAWLDALIDGTCPSPPTIAGHLVGGAIAARFAAEHRDRLDRLVLVDTFGLAPLRPKPRFALTLAAYLVRPSAQSQERFFRQCFVDLDAIREDAGGVMEQLEAYALERQRDPAQKAAIRALIRRFGVPTIPPDTLAALGVPVSLIWGRNDRQTKLRVAERASERYGWPLHVIDGAADDPAAERPREFVAAFRAALEDHGARRATTTREELHA